MPLSVPPIQIYNQANNFYLANIRLRGNDHPFEHLKAFAGPSLVLCAFSAELFLKCIECIETGSFNKGHNLKNLFHRLSKPTQRRIEELWDADAERNAGARELIKEKFGEEIPPDLDWALASGARGFEELRYSFDPANAKSKFFLSELPRMLRDVTLEMKPEWRVK